MEFKVEFYETVGGHCPVREFLDDIKQSDRDDFAAILAGLGKLRDRSITTSHSPRRSARGYTSYATSVN